MRRRDFIGLVAGVAWPLGARAQQPVMPIIGFLHSATADSYAPMTAAFRDGLRETSYVEGQTVAIEYRWAENQLDRLPPLAADLVRRHVAMIFTGGGAATTLAAKAATSTIPIVFANGTDPVEGGLVSSLSRPGGNITGTTFLNNVLGQKELEVLHQVAPKATVIAVLINPTIPTADAQSKDVATAARTLGLQIHALHASSERDLESVYASLAQLQVGGLVIGADAFLNSRRDQLVGLAARHSVPTVYPWREAVAAGGLVSYGSSLTDAYRQAGLYAGRILKGDKPTDLPVLQSAKTELVINLKTAKALGLDVSPALLARADEVIE
jgi:putative tryptophan/tyrosine transport system substrate-binding protein